MRCRRQMGVIAANTARSAHDSRGLRTWRRNTATSCRSTRISTSFDRELRASSPSQDMTCRKIRYNSRTATQPSSLETAALDQLLDDRVVFTSGSTGACYTKHDDLHLHRSRQQIVTKVSEEDLTVLVDGRTGVTWFLGTLEGTSPVGPSRPTALHPHLDPRRQTRLAHRRRPRQPRIASVVSLRFLGSWVDSVDAESDACAAGVV
jgi:hypothetical protein